MQSSETRAVEQGPPTTLLPFQDRINIVTAEDAFRWLVAGWHDFKAGGLTSLAYGAIFVAAGLLLTVGLHAEAADYLIAPFLEAFLFIGPALTVGFYAISRDLENGRQPTLVRAVCSWCTSRKALAGFGLALVAFMIVWMRFAVLIFALSFPYTPMDLQPMVNAVFFSPEGYVFLGLGTAVGAVLATLVFMASVVSLPMILDRGAGFGEAVVTSFVCVMTNFRALMVWAAIIVAVTGVGLLAGYVGLCVTLPLIGHASWHAYRALVKPDNAA